MWGHKMLLLLGLVRFSTVIIYRIDRLPFRALSSFVRVL